MITVSIDTAQELEQIRQLAQNTSGETAYLTEQGRPVLAVMPIDLYEKLLKSAQIPSDPRILLSSPDYVRQTALTIAAARAELLYETPELTSFEAYGDDDFTDIAD